MKTVTENLPFSFTFASISRSYVCVLFLRSFLFLAGIKWKRARLQNITGKYRKCHQTRANSVEYLTENVALNGTTKTYQRYQKTKHLFIFSLYSCYYYHCLYTFSIYLFITYVLIYNTVTVHTRICRRISLRFTRRNKSDSENFR